MPKGSCMCGDWKYEYEGEPAAIVSCHCTECRKNAGTNGSVNAIVSDDKFKKVSGTDKHWQRKGVSGKDVEYTFCDKCATLMIVNAEAFPGMKVLKPGTLDDKEALDNGKPVQEIFCKDRPKWCAAIDGAEQKEIA